MYDYREAMRDDIRAYLEENLENYDYTDMDDLREQLNDDLWVEDSVTGNGSGSYTFNAAKAKEYVLDGDNMDLLIEAEEEFGGDLGATIKRGWEVCDVTIRCYLLGQILDEVLKEMEDEGFFEGGEE